jgi:hypothetical protein
MARTTPAQKPRGAQSRIVSAGFAPSAATVSANSGIVRFGSIAGGT